MDLSDKVVVITGASAGVGAACARQFLAAGAKLVLAARGSDGLAALAAELDAADSVLCVPADVSDAAACTRLLDNALQRFGAINVLINNAGCNHRGEVGEVAPEKLAQIIEVNLRAPIVLTRMALPHLQRSGGAIVNVASIAGRVPLPHEATYSASKFGLRAFSFAMHEELRGSNVTVSAVSPGPIETGFILDEIESVPDTVFSQPMSSAEQIAAAVLACARDGRRERVIPALSGKLATTAYLFPTFFRVLRPLFEAKGRRAKQKYIARRGRG